MKAKVKLTAEEMKKISGGEKTLNELTNLIDKGNVNNLFCSNTKPCTSTDHLACSNSAPEKPSTKGCS